MPLLDTTTRLPLEIASGTAFELVLGLMLWLDEENAAAFAETAAWRGRFGARVTDEVDTLARDLFGDAGAVGELLGIPLELAKADASRLASHVASMRRRDLPVAREPLSTLLARWHEEVFAPEERELRGALDGAARAVRGLARRLDVDDVVAAATNGARLGGAGGSRVVLVPTVVWRPWVVQATWREALVVAFPGTGETAAATPAAVARVYRALGDETRLRMLQELAERDLVLNELADVAGVVKSTAHHHLVILRDAGLVTVDMSDDRRYRLRRDVVESLGVPLRTLLER